MSRPDPKSPKQPSKHDPKGVVNTLLGEALETHKEREAAYGGMSDMNVFQATADISNIVLGRDLNAMEIAFIFVAMKLGRFGNLLQIVQTMKAQSDDATSIKKMQDIIWDSVQDGMVYMALTERERQRIEAHLSKLCGKTFITEETDEVEGPVDPDGGGRFA